MLVADQVRDSVGAIKDLIGMGLLNQAEKLCLATMKSVGEIAELRNFLEVIEYKRGNKEKALRNSENTRFSYETVTTTNEIPDETGKYVAHYVMYTYDFFLEDSLESVYQHVDKILIARTLKPWFGKPVDLSETDDVLKRVIDKYGDKIELYVDQFPDEQSQRNFLLNISKSRKHKGVFIVDCDEVFVGESIERIYSFIEKNDPLSLIIPHLTFVKDASFCVTPPYETKLFFIKPTSEAQFTFARKCNLPETLMPYDLPEILHLSYIRKNDDEIWQKVNSFMHANDTDWSKWYNETYLRLNPHLRNFHPVWPEVWKGLDLFDIKKFPPNLFNKLLNNGKLFHYQKILDRKKIKLHLGCGSKVMEDYINIDLYSPYADLKSDIVHLGYFSSGSVDEIFMNAVFEHLYTFEQKPALQEWFRILKPDGVLRIKSVPDFDTCVEAYLNKKQGNCSEVFDLHEVSRYTHGEYTSENRFGQIHKDIFTKEKVKRLLEESGFEIVQIEIVRWEDEPIPCNIDVTARKSTKFPGGALGSQMDVLCGFKDNRLAASIDRAEQSIQSKNYDEAETILKRILLSFPFNIDALNDLAAVEIMKGKTENALEKLKRVLEIDPDNKVALGNLRLVEGVVSGQLATVHKSKGNGKNGASSLLIPIGTKEQQVVSIEVPLVSVIIPVFNQLEHTKKCVDAILRNTDYLNYEAIIINNGSTDGTKEYLDGLAKEQPRYNVIHSIENLGFVKGCNLAAEQAKGKYILFLNNDTEVQPGWLSSLVEYAESHEDCGAVGSKLIYPDGTLQEAGAIIFSDGEGYNYGRGMDPNDPQYNFAREVDYISGASLMIRSELWKKIGGLDLRYAPAYCEDSDLCFELRRHGYKVYYQPHSEVIHHENVTAGTNPDEGFKKYLALNRPKLVEKWRMELMRQYPNDPRSIEKASSRGISKRVLVVSPHLPFFNRPTHSLDFLTLLQHLRKMKYHVTFISMNRFLQKNERWILEEMGIETYAGDPEAESHFAEYVSSPRIEYERLFHNREFNLALIDTLYSAEYYMPIIRKYSPPTTVIINIDRFQFVQDANTDAGVIENQTKSEIVPRIQGESEILTEADRIWIGSDQERAMLLQKNPNLSIDVRPAVLGIKELTELLDRLSLVKEKSTGKELFAVAHQWNRVENDDAQQAHTDEREILSLVEAALESGDGVEARRKLRAILVEKPENTAALNDLAVAEIITKNWTSASLILSKVLDIDRENPVGLNNLRILKDILQSRVDEPGSQLIITPRHDPSSEDTQSRQLFMDEYLRWENNNPGHKGHAGGVFSTEMLRRIEEYLPKDAKASAETGCGKSTILFSNISRSHKVFTIDDRNLGAASSVNFFLNCPLAELEHIDTIYGPTQKTLIAYDMHALYDFVMIDGPHGYPFPELEYYFFYPHIRTGGLLILDDVNIPTIGRLADFVAEDDMFELVAIVSTTAIFRRTEKPQFDPYGDGWWLQKYNRRRVSEERDIFLADKPVVDEISSQKLDKMCHQ